MGVLEMRGEGEGQGRTVGEDIRNGQGKGRTGVFGGDGGEVR